MRYIKALFIIFACIFMGYFFVGQVVLPQDTYRKAWENHPLEMDWEMIKQDNTSEKITLPTSYHEPVEIRGMLPDKFRENTTCINFRGQDVKIYIDGKLRGQSEDPTGQWFRKKSAEIYITIPVTSEDTGKTISMVYADNEGFLYQVYEGTEMGMWTGLFHSYGVELIIAILALLLGVLVLVGSVILRIVYHSEVEIQDLAWGVLFSGAWLLFNSVFRQVFCVNTSIANDMPYLMIGLMPFPFLSYMNRIQKNRFSKAYLIVSLINVAELVCCVLLHVSGKVDFVDSFILMAGCCLLSIVFIFATVSIDYIKGKASQYPYVAFGLMCTFVAAIVQIVSFFRREGVFSGVIFAVGVIILLNFAIVGTVKDMIASEREKREAILGSEAKGRFLANMSHEIRTPINAIIGMNTMILRESKEPAIAEYAADIEAASENLLSIVNDILDITKIESGKLELVNVEYDLSSVLYDVTNMVRSKAEGKNLSFDVDVDQNLPSRLYGDDIRIRQIMVNLLNNAVKYTEEGSVRLSITGVFEDQYVTLMVSVEDTGIGIREEDIDKLFVAFERIEEDRNRNIEGTGLGMNITTQLLKQMGSALKVKSEYGKGSVFSFDLPQRIMSQEVIGDYNKRHRENTNVYEYEVSFEAPEAKILLVDDNAVNRKVVCKLLKETRVQVEEAASGAECLRMLRGNEYDLILLDHMMPEMDGMEVIKRYQDMVKEGVPKAPVIALTANAISGAREMYLESGFDEFLSKPIAGSKLEKMLRRFISKDKQILTPKKQKKDSSLDAVPERSEVVDGAPREEKQSQDSKQSEKKEISGPLLQAYLQSLIYGVEDGDEQENNRVLDALNQSILPQGIQESMEQLEQYVSECNQEKVVALVTRLKTFIK